MELAELPIWLWISYMLILIGEEELYQRSELTVEAIRVSAELTPQEPWLKGVKEGKMKYSSYEL